MKTVYNLISTHYPNYNFVSKKDLIKEIVKSVRKSRFDFSIGSFLRNLYVKFVFYFQLIQSWSVHYVADLLASFVQYSTQIAYVALLIRIRFSFFLVLFQFLLSFHLPSFFILKLRVSRLACFWFYWPGRHPLCWGCHQIFRYSITKVILSDECKLLLLFSIF